MEGYRYGPKIEVGCQAAFAGKPAPTGVMRRIQAQAQTRINCRSWLASEGGVSGEMDVECAGPIAGKPAPTMILAGRRFCIQPQSQESTVLLPRNIPSNDPPPTPQHHPFGAR
ncbi:hypothetical protein PMHK_04840 [Pseudomonas sp. MHK4]